MAIISVEDGHEDVMKRTVRLRHEAHVRSNDVCTQHSDSIDVTPGAKKTRLALNDYVTESTRLLAILWQGGHTRAVSDSSRLMPGGL